MARRLRSRNGYFVVTLADGSKHKIPAPVLKALAQRLYTYDACRVPADEAWHAAAGYVKDRYRKDAAECFVVILEAEAEIGLAGST
jgi:hypothetical protein